MANLRVQERTILANLRKRSSGGGGVQSVTGDGTTASVDNTDPVNPIVSAQLALDAANAYTDTQVIGYTDVGITAVGGAKGGSPIDPAQIINECSSISTGEYAYPSGGATWRLWVYPTPSTGQFILDVRKRTFGNTSPGSGDSICSSAYPSLSGNGVSFTSTGSISTWIGSPISKGDMVTIRPTTNTAAVQWWALFIPARRTF